MAEDIKKLIAKEVSRQRFNEQMIEHRKRVDQRRSRPPESVKITWGKVGKLPVPRPISELSGAIAAGVSREDSPVDAAPRSRIVERVIYVQPAPEPAKTRGKPGPKPGSKSGDDRVMCDLADKIMSDPKRRPRGGHGSQRKVARLVMDAMAAQGQPYGLSKVEKAIRSRLKEWRERG